MKNLLFSCLFLATFYTKAQKLELKTNLFNVLTGTYGLSAEYLADENLGVEITPSLLYSNGKSVVKTASNSAGTNYNYKIRGFAVQAGGKYYLVPKAGCDNFGISTFALYVASKTVYDFNSPINGSKGNTLSLGFSGLYKKVLQEKFVIEGGLGAAWAIFSDVQSIITDQSGSTTTTITNTTFGLRRRFTPVLNLSVGYRFGASKKPN